MSALRQMSFKLNLKSATRSGSQLSPRENDRPWDVTSPRRNTDPHVPRSPRNTPSSPRSSDLGRRPGSARLTRPATPRTPASDFDSLNKMQEKKTFILLTGSVQDIEAARRAISGVFSTENLAHCGARKICFGGNGEKYDIPNERYSVSGFTLLEVPQDAFRKMSPTDIRIVNIDPL